MPGGILRRPHAFAALIGNRIERPEQLPALGVERLHESADSVFAAVRADEDLPVDRGGGHRLAVPLLGVRDLRLPEHLAGLVVERDQLGVEGPEEELVAQHRHAAVVGPAAIGGYRSHRVLVVPELLPGGGVDRVDVIVGSGDVHDAVDDDGRGLHRLDDRGLEDEDGTQPLHVAGVDLIGLRIAGLRVILVGMQPVAIIAKRGVEHLLRNRLRHLRITGLHAARGLVPGAGGHLCAGAPLFLRPRRRGASAERNRKEDKPVRPDASRETIRAMHGVLPPRYSLDTSEVSRSLHFQGKQGAAITARLDSLASPRIARRRASRATPRRAPRT